MDDVDSAVRAQLERTEKLVEDRYLQRLDHYATETAVGKIPTAAHRHAELAVVNRHEGVSHIEAGIRPFAMRLEVFTVRKSALIGRGTGRRQDATLVVQSQLNAISGSATRCEQNPGVQIVELVAGCRPFIRSKGLCGGGRLQHGYRMENGVVGGFQRAFQHVADGKQEVGISRKGPVPDGRARIRELPRN